MSWYEFRTCYLLEAAETRKRSAVSVLGSFHHMHLVWQPQANMRKVLLSALWVVLLLAASAEEVS